MSVDDHRATASWGNMEGAPEFRAEQKSLIDEGRFRDAFQMDIDDIREKFDNKYDNEIGHALNYLDSMGL